MALVKRWKCSRWVLSQNGLWSEATLDGKAEANCVDSKDQALGTTTATAATLTDKDSVDPVASRQSFGSSAKSAEVNDKTSEMAQGGGLAGIPGIPTTLASALHGSTLAPERDSERSRLNCPRPWLPDFQMEAGPQGMHSTTRPASIHASCSTLHCRMELKNDNAGSENSNKKPLVRPTSAANGLG